MKPFEDLISEKTNFFNARAWDQFRSPKNVAISFVIVLHLFFLCESMVAKENSYKVFQPQFLWADCSCTQQGTGSFIKAPNGTVIGLTSAHFINFAGPQLLEVRWLDMKTGQPISSSTKSWGLPGREGTYEPLNLTSDFLLLVMESDVPAESILELDSRNSIDVGERVWFPDKASAFLIEGIVTEVNVEYLRVTLGTNVNLQSRSGTPVISQHTGKVIGILTGGRANGEHTYLYLAPGSSIFKAFTEAQQCYLLHTVIGKI